MKEPLLISWWAGGSVPMPGLTHYAWEKGSQLCAGGGHQLGIGFPIALWAAHAGVLSSTRSPSGLLSKWISQGAHLLAPHKSYRNCRAPAQQSRPVSLRPSSRWLASADTVWDTWLVRNEPILQICCKKKKEVESLVYWVHIWCLDPTSI